MKELGVMRETAGVYISVPFCKAKCTYCNFASGVFGAERMDVYVERVCGEMQGVRAEIARLCGLGELRQEQKRNAGVHRSAQNDSLFRNCEEILNESAMVDTVFLGGGTPSLLSGGQVRQLFETLRGEFEVAAGAEITLECAPGQLENETLEELLRQGMNRVSFGVQSFVDREAAAVGRLHTRAMCLAEIARMRAAGVENLNVDFIVGLPHQTAESWGESVEIAIASEVPHVSVYMLEVDEDSRLGREILETGARVQGPGPRYGAGAVPSEDETAEWYEAACGWLEDAGVRQYEISNFAREGFASRHNVKYWRREDYLGFGLDAHSMLRCGEDAVRWANGDELEEYLRGQGSGARAQKAEGLNVLGAREAGGRVVDWVGPEQGFEEALFLGLRMNVGVELERLRREFGVALVEGAVAATRDVEEAGLVECREGWLRLTGRGRMVSNEVFGRLLVGAAG